MNTVVQQEVMILENGHTTKGVTLTREITMRHGHARTAHNMSSSSLRKKSELALVSKVQWCLLRNLLINFQEVVLGTKLSILFLAIPFAFVAEFCRFGRVSDVYGLFCCFSDEGSVIRIRNCVCDQLFWNIIGKF